MFRYLRKYIIYFIALILPGYAYAQGVASQLFIELKQQVYQIRVIDLASGDKSSIGSGFQISKDGHLATNFHVVSSYVHEPEKFRLEYVYHDGSTGNIQLMDIDVIHDLAVVKIQPPQEKYFNFNLQSLSKGDRIYSMGNPHDLGMLIIEGNYNGLIQESRYKKILFSGSLNSGMSGGPAFDNQGRIIGINVSKGSEQLSFLVPVANLKQLYNRVMENGEASGFEEIINKALTHDQQTFYSDLLGKQWKKESLGEVELPGSLSDSLKCWGHTVDEEKIRYKGVHKHCESQDEIYIHSNMYAGVFSYDYEWITTTELNRFQFYNLIARRFEHIDLDNIYKEEDATNFVCHTDFVELSKHSWKVSTCLREYKKYSGLYDMTLLMTTVDMNHKAALIKVAVAGVSKENLLALAKKFMESIKWKN
ncbi:MAG: serine protease [Gammaproteobacteria bacterium]|nr:serine protease [Gammaproteobacteria bacterium]